MLKKTGLNRLLSIVLSLLASTLLIPLHAGASNLLVAHCHFLIQESGTTEGFIEVDDSYGVLEGKLTMLQPVKKTYPAKKVYFHRMQTPKEINALIRDEDIGEYVYKSAKINKKEIHHADFYQLDPDDDGGLASLLVYKDVLGRTLGQGGTAGTGMFLCTEERN